MKSKTIGSLKELQMQMPSIIQQYGSNNDFTHLALANPIVALERAGYDFTDEAQNEIEQHVRFAKEGVRRINHLKAAITEQVGEANIDNSEQLADKLIQVLTRTHDKNSPSIKEVKKIKPSVGININRDDLIKVLQKEPLQKGKEWYDELQTYSTAHPVIPLVLEYRKLQAENPPFASRAQIPSIEQKLKNSPLKNVVFTLQRNNNN